MIKVVWNIVKKILSIVMMLLSPIKRLWCRRKRKNSDTILPLSNHYPSIENLSPVMNGSGGQNYEELGSWDSWEEEQAKKIRSVEEYRQRQQQLLQKQTSKDEEPAIDYFQDMVPAVKRQKKVVISKKEDNINTNAISSKLAAKADFPVFQSNQLEAWEDDNNAWEDEDLGDLSVEAESVIREKRRAERQQRQIQNQRKNHEREQQRHNKGSGQFMAVKLS